MKTVTLTSSTEVFGHERDDLPDDRSGEEILQPRRDTRVRVEHRRHGRHQHDVELEEELCGGADEM